MQQYKYFVHLNIQGGKITCTLHQVNQHLICYLHISSVFSRNILDTCGRAVASFMEMCEPSVHIKHFQTTVILKCQLINRNEEGRDWWSPCFTALYQHKCATLGLDSNDANVLALLVGYEIRMGVILVGSKVCELINSPKTSKLIENPQQLWLKDSKDALWAWWWSLNLANGGYEDETQLLLLQSEMWKTNWTDTNWLVWGPQGGNRPRSHSCRATGHTRPTFLHFLACLSARFLPERGYHAADNDT